MREKKREGTRKNRKTSGSEEGAGVGDRAAATS